MNAYGTTPIQIKETKDSILNTCQKLGIRKIELEAENKRLVGEIEKLRNRLSASSNDNQYPY